MQFIDLAEQQKKIRKPVEQRLSAVLNHGKYIMGPEVFELEVKLKDFVGANHCITCSSGTDALLMALMAWEIGPGDAVLTTPFTFIATAEVIQLLGATPIFVDIDSKTFNIDPSSLESALNELHDNSALTPKAIIPVDLFGLPADYNRIIEIGKKHNIAVLGDGAQSFGAEINGKKTHSLGDAYTTSFFPAWQFRSDSYTDSGLVRTAFRFSSYTVPFCIRTK